MWRKKRTINQILKVGMSGIGMILLLFLLGKAADQLKWQDIGTGLVQEIKTNVSSWAVIIWKQNYPVRSADMENQAGHLNKSQEVPWYLRWVWNQAPVYRYLGSQSEKGITYAEGDPSYYKYKKKQEFYKEHEYLFQYGGEDTNQTVEDQIEDTYVEPEMTLTQMNTPAYTVRADRKVIGKQYVKEQLADYDFMMKHFFNVHPSTTAGRDIMNAERLLAENFKLESEGEKPQILIYHSHSQETFADYGPDHPNGTVVGIGNYLTELLTQMGYKVIHDTSEYDIQGGKLDRNKAYTYSLEGITEILQKNPSIQVVLDLHRDGVDSSLHMVSDINGKQTARIMFFNGMSQTPDGPIEYLQNPYREENLAFSLQMQLDAEAYYPGLTRKIYLKGLRYNLHLRPRSALIEVGAQTNTTQEAMNAMEPLAELLDMILQGK